ncbi:claudin-15 [Lates japonicus]|uniref:Claudin-15 n=1 Tax=Lates japonicus TaxID=270547 RepID=A0AAD3MHA0_LATJO|nr:claudin-15 [Lates japonicus]
MDPIVEVVALILGFIGWVMVGVALPNRYWRTSTVDGNVITTSTIYENLPGCLPWIKQGFPQLQSYIQASRALMITSIVLGTFGLVAALIGVQCSKAGGENYVLKGRIAGTAGILFILQGVCTMVSVSWYAFNITQEFFDPFYPGIRYEIGEGLYIGWCSAVLAIAGGSCLTCSCKMGTEEKYPLPYQTRGTVYSGAAPTRSVAASTYGRNAYV